MGEPWSNKYIFPNGMLPSIAQLGAAIEPNFVMEDWHNFGPYYDQTLMAWNDKFEKAWPGLRAKYGDRFYRMWRYYLLTSAGAFRSRSAAAVADRPHPPRHPPAGLPLQLSSKLKRAWSGEVGSNRASVEPVSRFTEKFAYPLSWLVFRPASLGRAVYGMGM